MKTQHTPGPWKVVTNKTNTTVQAAERDALQNDLDELRENVKELLKYAVVQDGPAFEGRDALGRIQEVL